MSIADRMINLRAEHGLNQRQLGELMHFSPARICQIETGKHKMRKTTEISLNKQIDELEAKLNEKV